MASVGPFSGLLGQGMFALAGMEVVSSAVLEALIQTPETTASALTGQKATEQRKTVNESKTI